MPVPLLTPRDIERLIWNQSVNNQGKKRGNIPLDESTEHSNNFIKQSIKNLGQNLSESAISRICKAESHTSAILEKLDGALHRHSKSGHHSNPCKERDLNTLITRAEEMQVFEEQRERSYIPQL